MGRIPVVIVLGPTAVGKTAISIDLAKKLQGEIISADSMQIYKYMNIGTAKPGLEERQGIPHHLLDIVYPNEDFNVSLFQDLANKRIKEIYGRGKLPIVAGGTGLYINSLIYPLSFTDAGEDRKYRQDLQREVEVRGKNWLHNELLLVDPQTANRLHPNDIKRIIRALEVHHITGRPASKQNDHHDQRINDEYSFTLIGLTMRRDILYERINKRVDIMLEEGLVDEVKWLLENGYKSHLNSMQGLGYKEMIQYLMGRRTLTESTYILKRDTRRFAKRQLTWFRRLTHVNWIHMEDHMDKDELVKELAISISEDIVNEIP